MEGANQTVPPELHALVRTKVVAAVVEEDVGREVEAAVVEAVEAAEAASLALKVVEVRVNGETF